MRLQAVPVERVVPDLCGVVEHTARGLLDDVFEAQVLELGALDQVVQVRDVGLVVLAVVELQRFLGDVRRQSVLGVRQRGSVCSIVLAFCGLYRLGATIVGDLQNRRKPRAK